MGRCRQIRTRGRGGRYAESEQAGLKGAMVKLGRILSGLGLYIGLLAAGCASRSEVGSWQGPQKLSAANVAEWTFGEEKARVLQSEHYHIYTTIQDQEVLDLLPQVMEGALSMYHQVANVSLSDKPLDCYLFRWRSEWDRFTQRNTGNDAKIYLQIRSGGYTLHDRYVAYYIGRLGTFSVAAHEGWHQFLGRNFKGRLPPFVEEGFACMFETISWQKKLPRWNLSINAPRAQALRKAIEANAILPLEKICAMHAGDIVGESNLRVDGFYAQAWAFARFLYEANNGKYRPALQKWLAETADGMVYDPTHTHNRANSPWNRSGVRPMIEHYLGCDIATLDVAYRGYMKKVAYEELPSQVAVISDGGGAR